MLNGAGGALEGAVCLPGRLGPCLTKPKAAVPRLRLRSSDVWRPHERGDSRMDRPGRIVTRPSVRPLLRERRVRGARCGPDGPLRLAPRNMRTDTAHARACGADL